MALFLNVSKVKEVSMDRCIKKYLLNNCDNRNFFQHYETKDVVYDFTENKPINKLFSKVNHGDQVIVLQYGLKKNTVTAINYDVNRIELNHVSLIEGPEAGLNGIVIGRMISKVSHTKQQAAYLYPELFNIHGNFKRGVNIKEFTGIEKC